MSADSPWLRALNRGGETPGPTRYMTLYDGAGWGDIFYPPPYEHSPRLEGARNLAYNVENDMLLDHLELGLAPGPLNAVLEFLRGAREPSSDAEPPRIVQTGALLSADQEHAQLTGDLRGAQSHVMSPTTGRWPAGITTSAVGSTRMWLSSPAAIEMASPSLERGTVTPG